MAVLSPYPTQVRVMAQPRLQVMPIAARSALWKLCSPMLSATCLCHVSSARPQDNRQSKPTHASHTECNGQQYINTGYIVQEDDVIEMMYISTSTTSADKALYGCYDNNGNIWFSTRIQAMFASAVRHQHLLPTLV